MTTLRLWGAIIASARQTARREGQGTPPVFIAPPAINGQPIVGVPCSFTPGTATGVPPPQLVQQWLLDGANVVGATSLTYTPQLADVGKTLAVRQSASNGQGTPANSVSAGLVVTTATTLGMLQANLPNAEYFDTTPVFVDMITQGFGLMVPGSGSPGTPVAGGSDGWPVVGDVEVVSQIHPPTTAPGSVVFEFTLGAGTASYSLLSAQPGDSVSAAAWNGTTKKQLVTLNYSAGRQRATFKVRITGAKRLDGTSNGFEGVRLARPGYTLADLDAGKVFTNEILAAAGQLSVLRFMDWNPANGTAYFGQGLDFARRPTPTNRRTTWSYAEDPTGATAKKLAHAWETCIALGNATGKGIWINLPINATDAYITALATLVHATSTSPRVHWEITNEPWGTSNGFQQFDVLLNKVATETNGYIDVSARTSGQNTRFIVSATRTAGIVTLVLSVPHTYVAGGTPTSIRYANIDGQAEVATIALSAVPSPTQVSFPRAGADGPVAFTSGAFLYDAATPSNLVVNASTNLFTARRVWMVRRTKEIGALVRSVVGDALMRTRHIPTYCWQSDGTDFDLELNWIKQTFPTQDPGYWVMGCGFAPYFGLDGTPVGLPNLAASTDPALVAGDYTAVLAGTAKVAKQRYDYENKALNCVHYSTPANPIELYCYEGGADTSSLGGSLPNGSANNALKSAAQIDPALEQPMVDYYSDLIRYGTNGSIPSQYFLGEGDPASTFQTDRWWTTDNLANLTRPKQAAMARITSNPRPSRTRRIGLGTFDMRLRAGKYEDLDPALLTTGLFPWILSADIVFNTSAFALSWIETASTPQTRSYSVVYVCNFANVPPWACHIDINGVRIATSQVLSASPANLTTEKTLGPFTFISRPGLNSIRYVRASGGSGRDGQFRRDTIA